VAENPEDLVTLKIRNEAREWVYDEQQRLRKRHEKLSHAEIFERMRVAYLSIPQSDNSGIPETKQYPLQNRHVVPKPTLSNSRTIDIELQSPSDTDLTPGEWKWVIRLVNILRSGTIAARGIKWNLLMICKATGVSADSLIPRRLGRKEMARIQREVEDAEALIRDAEEAGEKPSVSRKRPGGAES
jgi:hypothetical protein